MRFKKKQIKLLKRCYFEFLKLLILLLNHSKNVISFHFTLLHFCSFLHAILLNQLKTDSWYSRSLQDQASNDVVDNNVNVLYVFVWLSAVCCVESQCQTQFRAAGRGIEVFVQLIILVKLISCCKEINSCRHVQH